MPTQYTVLRLLDENAWSQLGEPVPAANDQQAIRSATADLSDAERAGTFVAVPTRSWRPRTRTIETKQVDKWS